MAVPESARTGSKGRKRGGPLRIDRTRIIEAARAFDPQTLTMQAVADTLGVDRKAINYHVTDREGLLRLVAEDTFNGHFAEAFSRELERVDGSGQEAWRGGARAWAVAVRDSMVATNVVTSYSRLYGDNPAVFEPVELVLQRMITAGFDLQQASRAVILLTRLAMGVGHDVIVERQLGEHPQGPEVRRLLTIESDPEKYPAFRALIAAELNGLEDIDAQFDFEVDTVVTGLARSLA